MDTVTWDSASRVLLAGRSPGPPAPPSLSAPGAGPVEPLLLGLGLMWGFSKGPCCASRLLGWAPSLPGFRLSPALRLWICGSRTHPWDPGGQGSPEQVRLHLLRKEGRPQAPAATPDLKIAEAIWTARCAR